MGLIQYDACILNEKFEMKKPYMRWTNSFSKVGFLCATWFCIAALIAFSESPTQKWTNQNPVTIYAESDGSMQVQFVSNAKQTCDLYED